MIPVSKIDWQYLVWVERWDNIFFISREELWKLNSKQAILADDVVADIIIESIEPTAEELLAQQEKEKQSQILTEYPIERQLSILTKGLVELSTDRQLQDMITFISSLDNTDVQPTK